jgi:hypothetical protein
MPEIYHVDGFVRKGCGLPLSWYFSSGNMKSWKAGFFDQRSIAAAKI